MEKKVIDLNFSRYSQREFFVFVIQQMLGSLIKYEIKKIKNTKKVFSIKWKMKETQRWIKLDEKIENIVNVNFIFSK